MASNFRCFFLLLLLLLCPLCQCLRILIYQDGLSSSQMAFTRTLAHLLVERGHIVDKLVMEFNPAAIAPQISSSSLRNMFRVQIPAAENGFIQLGHMSAPFHQGTFPRRNRHFEQTRVRFCAALVNDDAMITRLRSAQYDVFLTSVYLGCPFGIFHLIANIPTLLGYSAIAGTDRLFPLLGIPEPSSYVSSVLRPYGYGQRLSFWARAQNEWDRWLDSLTFDPVLDVEQPIFTARFPHFPPLAKIARRLAYVFLNTNELLDLPRPIAAKIKHIGGITLELDGNEGRRHRKAMNFSDNFLSAATPSKEGLILFSFGSLVKTWQIPARIEAAIVDALCQFPNYTILWKYDDGFPANRKESAEERMDREEAGRKARECRNVIKMEWMPQKALLSDPRMRLFITHAGLNSYLESAHAGVPIVAIPFLGDQFYNAGCAVHKNGLGILVEKGQLDGPRLASAIGQILGNSNYSTNARRLARMLASRSNPSPKQTFLEHLEFAAKFPAVAENLAPASVGMPLWKLHNLDVWLLAIGMILVVAAMGPTAVSVGKPIPRNALMRGNGIEERMDKMQRRGRKKRGRRMKRRKQSQTEHN